MPRVPRWRGASLRRARLNAAAPLAGPARLTRPVRLAGLARLAAPAGLLLLAPIAAAASPARAVASALAMRLSATAGGARLEPPSGEAVSLALPQGARLDAAGALPR